jgi:competence protein ComEC
LLLPVLSFAPQRPASGHWRLLAFDVGQGGAVLLQTQTHDVLFDTGPRQGVNDAGVRTLLPNLRALGVGKLDSVVVSHADSDHAGGLLTVLNALPVGLLYSSFSFQEWLRRASSSSVSASLKKEPTQVRLCERGQRWVWDGVVFQFLHPEVMQSSTKTLATKPATVRATKSKPSKNAQSCVLYIQGAYHSALLPGDIGVKQEELLLDLQLTEQPASERSAAKAADAANSGLTAPNTLQADLVVVAHHGSETSSSVRFVQQLRAQHAIAQTGYLNRFGHPHPAIRQRWLEAQTKFWHTDHHGAILAESSLRGLIVQNYSQLRQRYWHRRSP